MERELSGVGSCEIMGLVSPQMCGVIGCAETQESGCVSLKGRPHSEGVRQEGFSLLGVGGWQFATLS